jgi:hypothetical protein
VFVDESEFTVPYFPYDLLVQVWHPVADILHCGTSLHQIVSSLVIVIHSRV